MICNSEQSYILLFVILNGIEVELVSHLISLISSEDEIFDSTNCEDVSNVFQITANCTICMETSNLLKFWQKLPTTIDTGKSDFYARICPGYMRVVDWICFGFLSLVLPYTANIWETVKISQIFKKCFFLS